MDWVHSHSQSVVLQSYLTLCLSQLICQAALIHLISNITKRSGFLDFNTEELSCALVARGIRTVSSNPTPDAETLFSFLLWNVWM